MTHQDMIVDQDPFFIIDPSTRRITNQSKSDTNVIQYDHNSQRFTFSLPRYVDGHDMSNCGVIEVHYSNIDAVTKEEITGVYLVDDIKIDDTDDTKVTLTWLLSQNVTQRVGKLDFLIKFMCYSDDVLEYAWNTAICSGIAVGKGMSNNGTVEAECADIISSLTAQMGDIETALDSIIAIQNELMGVNE